MASIVYHCVLVGCMNHLPVLITSSCKQYYVDDVANDKFGNIVAFGQEINICPFEILSENIKFVVSYKISEEYIKEKWGIEVCEDIDHLCPCEHKYVVIITSKNMKSNNIVNFLNSVYSCKYCTKE